MEFKIANKSIGGNHPLFFIAEAGVNHNGSLDMARKLVDKAKESGVDAVKFQTYDLKNFYSRDTDKKRIKQLKKFQLSHNSIIKLSKYAKKLGLVFFSTPLDVESAIFLNKVQKIFKLAGYKLFIFLENTFHGTPCGRVNLKRINIPTRKASRR